MVCVIAPVIIGFLPSAGAVNICGAIVDKATGKDLDVEEKTFVTSYYRHISESFSPTYNAILLALSITAVSTGQFVLLWRRWLWCFWYWDMYFICGSCRKDMKQVRMKRLTKRRIQTASVLFLATGALYCACDRTESFCDQGTAVYYCAFDYCISVKSEGSAGFCKDIGRVENHLQYDHSDDVQEHSYLYRAIGKLPDLFAGSAIPQFAAFGIIMFLGTIISGANSMIVLLIPLAFASIPHAGAGLLVYLMALSYAAMQISPTHICLAIITEYFRVSWGQLMKKTIPVIVVFVVILTGYYVLLSGFGI